MASINKRQVKTGVRYRVNGRQREKSFKRKADAVKFRATIEADLSRGDWIDVRQSKQTVAEFAEKWFATLGGHRASTRTRYRAILDRHVLPEFGDPPIGRVDYHSVAVWVAEQAEQGLSAASISKHRNVLSQICGSAIRAGAMRSNPVDGIRIAKSPTTTSIPSYVVRDRLDMALMYSDWRFQRRHENHLAVDHHLIMSATAGASIE